MKMPKWIYRGLAAGAVFAVSFIVAQVVTYTTFASLPATSPGGTLNVLSDSVMAAYNSDSAGTRQYFGPLFPFSLVPQSGWSWTNQGGASVATSNGTIYMQNTAASGDNIRVYKRSQPSTPYSIVAGILPMLPSNISPTNWCGIGLYESGTGKLATLYVTGGGTFEMDRWNSVTSFGAGLLGGYAWKSTMPIFIKITNDGTNVSMGVSADKVNFIPLGSQTVASMFTSAPDNIAIIMNQNSSSAGTGEVAGCTFVSWGN